MEKRSKIPRRPIWAGSLTIGLVNVPVKLYPMIYDRGISFRFLHKNDGHPLKYQKICTKDNKLIPWEEVAKGYEVAKNEYVIFAKEELEAINPESDKRIRLDKFIDYFAVDPIYFGRSYVLLPDRSDESYSLLLMAFQKKGKAGVGKITLRTKEYPAVIHAYKNALVLTTLRYAYDVVDPRDFEELQKLKEPEKSELELAFKIVTDLSGEFDITEYEDSYKQKVEDLIKKKLKGQTVIAEKPVQEEARSLMVALRDTLKQLEKK
ncbi:Ku protein [Candidatus Bathyarchaeota archaeon]|nr:Ku protein [Candidatus Bathyarchaeota archaeon]